MVMFGAEMWELDFNSPVTVNTSAMYQRPGNWGNQRKTRLMSAEGGGGGCAISLQYTIYNVDPGGAEARPGPTGERLPSCGQEVRKTKELFSSFP